MGRSQCLAWIATGHNQRVTQRTYSSNFTLEAKSKCLRCALKFTCLRYTQTLALLVKLLQISSN